jgi:hypothetical protein
MNYDKYLKICRNLYKDVKPPLDKFYSNPVKRIPTEEFSKNYINSINFISEKVKLYFDQNPTTEIMNWYPNFLHFENELEIICKELVPWLEKNTYGCYLFVDKIYIYRTSDIQKRESSYKWHYDNNPEEIVKNIIYLNDVNENNSPFEYLQDPNGNGVIFEATRKGTDNWDPAPNDSRLDDEVDYLIKNGYCSFKVLGSIGTTYSFSNDAAHRANPVIEGYRDVINIRVKPTTTTPPMYINKKWTTDNKISGVVNSDPEKDWKYYNEL